MSEQEQEQKNELVETKSNNLLQFSPEKIEVIRRTVAKGATDDELEMFMHLAQRYQLDPFSKEIWFIKRPKKFKDTNGNWDYKRLENGEIDYTGVDPIIMTSRDGYLKLAQSDPDFEELNSLEIRQKDNFSFNPMTKEINHEIGSERGPITGAWAICKRKNREPAIVVVDFNEYKKAAGNNPVWDNYPSRMITKVAEVIVLKRQFNISGLVTEEEMPRQYSLEYDDPNLKRLDKRPEKGTTIEHQSDETEKKRKKELWLAEMEQVKDLMDQLGLAADELTTIAMVDLGLEADRKLWSLQDVHKVKESLMSRLSNGV
ncbi:RecT family recombinase [Bacillus sp. FSL K6-0047]|uniref:RecT family recombinase n=1 Tax=Shouchella clausii TaxID=79880 RepID=UPI0028A0E470|nr:RecT family recombinase [Shouchella clausii]